VWNPGAPIHAGNVWDYTQGGWRERRQRAWLRGAAVSASGVAGAIGSYWLGAGDPDAKRIKIDESHYVSGPVGSGSLSAMPSSRSRSFRALKKRKRGKRVVRVASALVVPEVKAYYPADFLAAAYTTAGTLGAINLLTQGVASNQRIGRDVKFVALDYQFELFRNAANAYTLADQTEVSVRMIVYYDREAIGANPAVTTILQAALYNSPYNTDNVCTKGCRFSILKDKTWNVSPTIVSAGNAAAYGAQAQRLFKGRIRLNAPTHYANTSAGTVADILKGAIGYLVIGSTNSGNAWSVNIKSLLYFVD